MSRFVRLLVFVLVGLALLLPGAALAKKKKKKKHVVQAKTELEAGQPLRVDIGSDLTACVEWDCWLFIGEPKDDFKYMLEVEQDGTWVAFAKEEDDSEDEEDEDAEEEETDEEELVLVGETGVEVEVKELPEEDCTKIKLAEHADAEEQKEKEKIARIIGGEVGVAIARAEADKEKKADEDAGEATDPDAPPAWMDLPVLTLEERQKCHRRNGAAGKMTVEKVRGEIAGEAPARYIMIPADLLPTGDFEVTTNGHWGALIDGEKVGWKEKTGAIRILR